MNVLDPRLFSLPDRGEVVRNMDEKTRGTPLSSMQLWEVEDGPVIIGTDGEAKILSNGAWEGMDPWETVFEGRPLTFFEFSQRWPGLVSEDSFLASFTNILDTEEPKG